MSLTSQLIEIGFAGLPQAVTSQLQEIGRMDKITRNLTIQLNKEENKLLDTLKLIAKNDPSFDEEPLKKAAASISQRRLLVSQMIEEQMKALQSIYVYLDRKIAYFDSNIKIHAPQLQTENDVSEVCLILNNIHFPLSAKFNTYIAVFTYSVHNRIYLVIKQRINNVNARRRKF